MSALEATVSEGNIRLSLCLTNESFYSEIGTQVIKKINSSVNPKMSALSTNNFWTSLISIESSSKLSLTETLFFPWHNNTRIYQAIGRGLRFCSHAALDPDERNVTIFKYASTVPDFGIEADERVTEEMLEMAETYGISEETMRMETTDEAMYNRIVQKDINTKKIERIMKEIAIDCEQNKHVNYFGVLDVCPEGKNGSCDYSRLCDYQPCEYDCIGYKDKIQYLTVDFRKLKDAYQIGTDGETVFTCDDTENTRDVIIRILELLESPVPERATCEHLWNVLSKKVGKINTDTDTGVQQILMEIPRGKVDNSTYNIYFSRPQINKAKLYITQMFRKNLAVTIPQVVHILTTMDPLLEQSFIYTAMNELVGNPPYLLPEPVYDKFNQP
jgi:hypothetical protein